MVFGQRTSEPTERVGAVVVAAGSSRRMGGMNKLLMEVGGLPVLAYTLSALQASPCIGEMVLVCREADMPEFMRIADCFGIHKLRTMVVGGESRQQSVFAGVRALGSECRYYCIHDGARPFVTHRLLQDCLSAARLHGCATAAVPVKDTIKQVSPDGRVLCTPPREALYAVQTPQIFRAGLYQRAMEYALAQGLDCTDDCQLVEAMGEQVFIAQGDYRNIKITTAEDIAAAEAFLEEDRCE